MPAACSDKKKPFTSQKKAARSFSSIKTNGLTGTATTFLDNSIECRRKDTFYLGFSRMLLEDKILTAGQQAQNKDISQVWDSI